MRSLKTDKRLLGAWKSDRRRTIREWRFDPTISPEKRRKFLTIFGKLVITYTPRLATWKMDDYKNRHPYEVLGTDWHSVCIKYCSPTTNEEQLEYITFEGDDRYYVCFGKNREWFKRIK